MAQSRWSAGIEPALQHAARNLAGFHTWGAFIPRSRSANQMGCHRSEYSRRTARLTGFRTTCVVVNGLGTRTSKWCAVGQCRWQDLAWL